ncbi:DUF397 domain-containing protein [Pseudonocardia sp. HH130630-07]|uniref:DUF397 domain-containing protein n=1 Tax=Pseudonocardia sp. HH130630-07 TaxID=1690815 RepID=UPI0008152918|nr:DUF397 domain-containing protein [Pseudonocardia sp. HH130630-07]ANY08315.1 DUF397 domain-containing protein [Pseudonocardia sp. HH130630-07]
MNSSELAGARWHTSSYSGSEGQCVEVAVLDDGRVAVRDTKDAGCGPALVFGGAQWSAFAAGVTRGEFGR